MRADPPSIYRPGLFGGPMSVYSPLVVLSLLTGIVPLPNSLDCVFSLASLDRPAANLLEIAATNIRAAETPRFP